MVRNIIGLIGGVIFFSVYFYAPAIYFSFLLSLVAGLVVLFEWKNIFHPASIWFWLILPIYPVLPFIFLILLNQSPEYRILLLLIFIIGFIFDIGSYYIGKLFGRHKLCPATSPGKTWEGFVGGCMFASVAMLCFYSWQGLTGALIPLFLLTFLLSVIFLLGDLFESMLKRRANIKDSGVLMPGHGGFLDRFDAVLFAGYFVYLFRDYLLQLLH
ncbi:MAG TPA: phosphatidate cytidylyltransferase [Candidatus Babeliales bacterium]|nr:phosphatidate cytidylyltransferase [Candidatus Babeliales bacterium]